MRILLRLVAAYTLAAVIRTLCFIGIMWHWGNLGPLLRSGPLGILTFAGWFFTFVAGVPAIIFLWKLTDPGRIAAAITWGSVALYYLLLLTVLRSPGTHDIRGFLPIIGSTALVAFVLSPAARRACQQRQHLPVASDTLNP